jgi:hypothetical protein
LALLGSSQRKSCGFQEISGVRSSVLACIAMPRDKDVYFAKLAEQAERYDEMADYMQLGNTSDRNKLDKQH